MNRHTCALRLNQKFGIKEPFIVLNFWQKSLRHIATNCLKPTSSIENRSPRQLRPPQAAESSVENHPNWWTNRHPYMSECPPDCFAKPALMLVRDRVQPTARHELIDDFAPSFSLFLRCYLDCHYPRSLSDSDMANFPSYIRQAFQCCFEEFSPRSAPARLCRQMD